MSSNNEEIKIVIDLLNIAMKFSGDNRKKIMEVVDAIINYENKALTDEEIRIGQEEGKLKCVKFVKERLQMSLMETKKFVEKEFEERGFKFKVWVK